MKLLSHPVVPPLVPVFLAMMTGILAASASFLPNPVLMVVISSLLLVFSLAGTAGSQRAVAGICLAAGIWSGYQSHQIHHPQIPSGHISRFYNQQGVVVTGKIVSFSRHYPHKIQATVACQSIRDKDAHGTPRIVPARGKIYLNIYGNEAPALGFHDTVRFSGPVRPIRNFGNPGAFDYQTFLKRQGIFGAVHTGGTRVQRVSDTPLPLWVRGVQQIEVTRNRFYEFVMTTPAPLDAAHILAALTTGIKHSLPAGLRDQYARAGTSHLLAISGLHMGILCLIFFFFFFRLLSMFHGLLVSAAARKTAGILTLIPLFVFAFFSGFSPSTQRAFIMVTIFMISFLGERQTHPVNTLAGAGVLILLADPAALFSISFQLSFTAVLFIVLGMGVVHRSGGIRIRFVPKFLVSICVLTLLAGVGTFPLIAGYFNLVSLVQVPANLVLVPVIGFVCLPLGLLSLAAWPLFPALAGLLLNLAGGLADLCTRYIQWLADLPFAWSWLPALTFIDLAAIYTVLAACFCAAYFKKIAPVAAAVIILLAGGYSIHLISPPGAPDRMTVTVLDVGQGNAAVIQTIEGKKILVDGGGFTGGSGFDVGRNVVAPFLWKQGIRALDAVILTHPDTDHMNGLVFILENFTVRELVKNTDTSPHESFDRIMAACRRRQIPVFVPDCEDRLRQWDRTRLEFFQCDSVVPGLDANNNSLVFRLDLDQFSMLFPGDIMRKREQLLAGVPEKQLAARILLAPHHGSRTSSTSVFLDRIEPEAVIVSCGFNNPYRFPHPDVLERYMEKNLAVFRTDLHGAVTITSSGKGYAVATHYSEN